MQKQEIISLLGEIEDAEFEAELLIRQFPDENDLRSAVKKRSEHYPLQYILGSQPFFEDDFIVGEGVLIPRPETEFLVEIALSKIPANRELKIIDLCAGSGCIGLTLAKKLPKSQVVLFEKSPDAIEYERRNLTLLGLKNVKIVQGDLFDGCREKYDVLITNPPYISACEIPQLQSEVGFEPRMALDGGSDGLDFYRAIAEKWLSYLNYGGLVFAECGEEQPRLVTELFGKYIKAYCENDQYGVERFVIGEKL